jgi:RNA polymerase sigma factor (sigma-70 family)
MNMAAPSEMLATLAARDHYGQLLAYFVRRVKSPQDAEDLCQEVLARLLKLRVDAVSNPLPYIFKVAANVIADHFSGTKLRVVPLDERAADQAPHLQEDLIPAVEFGEDLLRALLSLPANIARDVYIKRLLDGTPFAQIAAELKITVPTAHTYFYNVNEHIWKFISGQGEHK